MNRAREERLHILDEKVAAHAWKVAERVEGQLSECVKLFSSVLLDRMAGQRGVGQRTTLVTVMKMIEQAAGSGSQAAWRAGESETVGARKCCHDAADFMSHLAFTVKGLREQAEKLPESEQEH